MKMTFYARDLYHIPEETASLARDLYDNDNVYVTMRDKLDLWYKDSDYASLFTSTQGRPVESPGRLNLIMVMQYAEGLTDQQAAEFVRSRIDWKYALGLAMKDRGFHHSLLSDHRQRLIEGGMEQQLLNDMLKRFQECDLLKERSRQRTDSTQVLASIRELNRLELLGETMRYALNSLAVVVPNWLQAQVSADWFDLYDARFEQYRLPKSKQERQDLAERIGNDGYHLLSAMAQAEDLPWLREIPAVDTLQQVWEQQFVLQQGQAKLRPGGTLPPAAEMINSPYDVEARYSRHRQVEWTGYGVHLTETCEDDKPLLITNVETTPATTPDSEVTDTIHRHLSEKNLLPGEHIVDAGYVDAGELVTSKTEHGIDLLGPVQKDTSWQAKADQGFDLACFVVQWDTETVICPQGKTSSVWCPRKDEYGNTVIEVRFRACDCRQCSDRPKCTRSQARARCLKLRPRAQHIALQQRRRYQKTDEYKERYKKRAGVEGAISQGTRCFDLRRARYVGLAKTHLQHVLAAAAMNLTRAVAWMHGTKRALTRRSPFAALALAA
jgi:transposase